MASTAAAVAAFPEQGQALHQQRRLQRTVVMLNNTAVDLVVRGSYREALDCILTCIYLTKHVAEEGDVVGAATGTAEDDTTNVLIERATELIAFATARGDQDETSTDSSKPAFATPNTAAASSLSFLVVSSDYDPNNIYMTLASSVNNNRVKFPMTICHGNNVDECSFSPTDDDLCDVNFYSSVVLYNYGVVHDCLAAVADTARERAAYHQKAYRIFQLTSHLVYSEIVQRNNATDVAPINVFSIGKILQFKAYLSHNLIQACDQLQVAALDHLQNLEDVLRLIDAREGIIRTTIKDYASAA